MECTCTNCGELVSDDQNLDGRNYCINCGKFVEVPSKPKVPTWMWGVVVVLLANWQILRTVHAG